MGKPKEEEDEEEEEKDEGIIQAESNHASERQPSGSTSYRLRIRRANLIIKPVISASWTQLSQLNFLSIEQSVTVGPAS